MDGFSQWSVANVAVSAASYVYINVHLVYSEYKKSKKRTVSLEEYKPSRLLYFNQSNLSRFYVIKTDREILFPEFSIA